MSPFKRLLFALAVLTLLSGVNAFDRGGVSVDLSPLRGGSLLAEQDRPNLLRDGDFADAGLDLGKAGGAWLGSSYVWSGGLRDEAQRQALRAGAVQRRLAEGGVDNSACVQLLNPLALQEMRDENGKPDVSGRIRQNLSVEPSAQPVKYQLSLMVKGKSESCPGQNSFRAFVRFLDKPVGERNAAPLREDINHAISLPANWELRTLTFIAPPATRQLEIILALYGLGEVNLDDVRLQTMPMETGLSASVTPWTYLDNTWHVAEDQPASIVFLLHNESKAKISQGRLKLLVPEGFSVEAGNEMCKLLRRSPLADGGSEVWFDVQFFVNNIPADGYSMWRKPAVLLKTSRKAGPQLYPLQYGAGDGDAGVTALRTLQLRVMAPFRGERPRRFVSGFQTTHEFLYGGAQAAEVVAFFSNSGCNAVHGRVGDKAMQLALKEAGFARYVQPHYLCNGYRIGDEKGRTEESYFRQMDGTPFRRAAAKTCPYEVYSRGPFYRSNVLGSLESMLVTNDDYDQVMPNWEPYYLDFKGCFCERCREEFIRFAPELPADAVRASWPATVVAEFRDRWVAFRSWQHGRVVVTLEQDINALGRQAGKDSHFIPEIAWSQLIDAEVSHFAQYSPLDYLSELPWIEPWGPYIFSNFTEKYEYYPGIHLIPYMAARDNKRFVEKHVADPAKRPKLIAMPQGFQCGTWVTEPEAFAFDTLAFFFNRWEGSFGYYFPQGYDHRYWAAFAAANTLIARCEDDVYDGEPCDERVTLTPLTGLPEPHFPAFWNEGGNFKKRLPGLVGASILQHKAYARGGGMLVAVGNFWLRGESYFKLQISGLEPSRRYAVNLVAGDSLGVFSGQDLAAGIRAQAGALRWQALRVVADGEPAGTVITPAEVARRQEAAASEIGRQLEAEAEAARLRQAEDAAEVSTNDFAAVYELSGDGVALKAVKEGGRDYLQVQGHGYVARLDPDVAGRLASLKVAGQEWLYAQDETGFGVDAIWWPARLAYASNRWYKIVGMALSDGGIKVELVRTLTRRDKPALAGLELHKTYRFTASAIALETVVRNGGGEELELAFRYHNLPAPLGKPHQGTVAFADGQQLVRELSLKLARFGEADRDLDTAYKVNKFMDIDGSRGTALRLSAPALPGAVAISCSGDAPLYGIIFWDAGDFSTLEPLYRKSKLGPGQSTAFRMVWELKP